MVLFIYKYRKRNGYSINTREGSFMLQTAINKILNKLQIYKRNVQVSLHLGDFQSERGAAVLRAVAQRAAGGAQFV